MRRKIIKQGNDSYTLTLPVKWVRRNHIDSKAEVELCEEDNKIVVSPVSANNIKECTVSIKDRTERDLVLTLSRLYKNGYSQMTLTDVTSVLLKKIEDVLEKELSGIEISMVEGNKCVLEVTSEPRGDNYQVLLRRIFFIIQESVSLIIDNRELGKVSKLAEKAKSHQRFCKRFIVNNLKTEDGYDEYSLLSYIIIIETDLRRISELMIKHKAPLSKQVKDEFVVLLDIVKRMSSAFFKKDVNELYSINKRVIELMSAGINKLSSVKEKEIYHFYLEILRIIYSSLMPMVSLAASDGKQKV